MKLKIGTEEAWFGLPARRSNETDRFVARRAR